MLNKTFRVALVILAAAALLAVAGQGNAQEAYPTKPVQMVPAGSPGGGLDIHARAIEQALTVEKMLDKPFTSCTRAAAAGIS